MAEYIDPSDLDDILTIQEGAKRHLQTWTKKQLIQHLLLASKDSWLKKWADDYKETTRE